MSYNPLPAKHNDSLGASIPDQPGSTPGAQYQLHPAAGLAPSTNPRPAAGGAASPAAFLPPHLQHHLYHHPSRAQPEPAQLQQCLPLHPLHHHSQQQLQQQRHPPAVPQRLVALPGVLGLLSSASDDRAASRGSNAARVASPTAAAAFPAAGASPGSSSTSASASPHSPGLIPHTPQSTAVPASSWPAAAAGAGPPIGNSMAAGRAAASDQAPAAAPAAAPPYAHSAPPPAASVVANGNTATWQQQDGWQQLQQWQASATPAEEGTEAEAVDPWLAVMSSKKDKVGAPAAAAASCAPFSTTHNPPQRPSSGSGGSTQRSSANVALPGAAATAATAATESWTADPRASTGPAARTHLQRKAATAAGGSASSNSSTHAPRAGGSSAATQQASAAGAAAAEQLFPEDDFYVLIRQQHHGGAVAEHQPGSDPGSGGGSEIIEMAFAQLLRERPDVAPRTTKELRAKIKAMPLDAALAAVGALAELPESWAEGLGIHRCTADMGGAKGAASWALFRQQQEAAAAAAAAKHLEGVVARAVAHLQQVSGGGGGGGGMGRTGSGNASKRGKRGSSAGSAAGGQWQGEQEEEDADGWQTVAASGSKAAKQRGAARGSSSARSSLTVAAPGLGVQFAKARGAAGARAGPVPAGTLAAAAGDCFGYGGVGGGGGGGGDNCGGDGFGGGSFGGGGELCAGSSAADSWGEGYDNKADSFGSSGGSSASSRQGAAAAGNSARLTSAGSGGAAAGGSPRLQAAWLQLEQERPEVFCCLDERHVNYIAKQNREEQLQLLHRLMTVHSGVVQGSKECAARQLTNLIMSWLHIKRQLMAPKVAAALQAFAEHHPQVTPYMDAFLLNRLAILTVPEALAAVEALETSEYGPRWETRCKNPSAWLMGVVSRALREGGFRNP